MECKWCGNQISSNRMKLFCNKRCVEEYKQTQGAFAPRVSAVLSMKEIRKRKALIKRAIEGDEIARTRLRLEYGLISIWDGKRLVRL